jgi:hypothetical protein
VETGDFRRGQEGRSTQQDTPPPTAPRDHTKSTKNRQVQKNFDVDEHRNILGTLDTSVNNHQNKQKADQSFVDFFFFVTEPRTNRSLENSHISQYFRN